jgi:AraC family ethanolamine operon transcriptional activator
MEASVNRQQDFHVVLLISETLEINILRLQLKEAIFEFRTLNIPLRIWGDKKTDTLVFELVLSPIIGRYLSHGFAIDRHTLYGFDHTRGIDLVLPAGLLMGTLIIKREVFQDYLEIMDRDDFDDRFFSKNYISIPTAFAPVQTYLRELYSLLKNRSPFLNSYSISQLILEDYVPLLINAIPPTRDRVQKPPRFFKRSHLVVQAEEYMRAHLEKPITLKDICQVLQISKSPLSYGFQEIFGLSPMAYLRILRLQAIYKLLKRVDPNTTKIAVIAHRFGFWHTGRFSQYYKQMFGELPSETLHNR